MSYSEVSTGTWRSMDDVPGAAYDPVSGHVVIVSRIGMWIYEPRGRTATEVLRYNDGAMGYLGNLLYFPTNDRLYYIARASPIRVWEVALDRATWENSTLVELGDMQNTPNSSGVAPGWAVDTRNNVIAGSVSEGQVKVFDPVARRLAARPAGGGGQR